MKRVIKASDNDKYDVVLEDGFLFRDDNGDIHERVSDPVIVTVPDIDAAVQAVQDWINRMHLGGSTFSGGLVLQNNKPVKVISYNGRVTDFDEYIRKWGQGLLYNSQVLKSLGYRPTEE